MILLADSEGPDQTARMRRLIWAFTDRAHMPEDTFSHGATHLLDNYQNTLQTIQLICRRVYRGYLLFFCEYHKYCHRVK